MEVSINSWHYRWLKRWGFAGRIAYDYKSGDYVRKTGPKSLCIYFWTLMFTFLTTAIVIVVALGLVTVLVSAAILHPKDALIVAGSVIGVSAVLALVWWQADRINSWVEAYFDKKIAKHIAKADKPKEPNIFWEFIKAKKRKVCPLIEYK